MVEININKRRLFLDVCHEFHSFPILPAEFAGRSQLEIERISLRRNEYRRLMREEASRSLNDLGGLLSSW